MSGVQLRVAGFPTTIQPMFLVVIGFIGWYPGITAARLALWVVLAVGAILWHELGHATAARRLGAAPTIELYGLGGITRWQPTHEPRRRDLIGVTLAGPGAGFLIGGLTAIAVVAAGGMGSGDTGYIVRVLLWTNVGWGLVNLLPVLPLDGGHVIAELLPGDRVTRHRRAALLSVAVGLVAAVLLVRSEFVFGGVIAGWIAFSNLSTLQADRSDRARRSLEAEARLVLDGLARGERGAEASAQRVLAELRPHAAGFRSAAIETAVAAGNAGAARALLTTAAPSEQLPPALHALVFAVESGGRDGVAEMIEIYRREPTVLHGRWLVVALHCGGRLPELAAMLMSTPAPVDPAVIAHAAEAADNLGHPAAAAAARAVGST